MTWRTRFLNSLSGSSPPVLVSDLRAGDVVDVHGETWLVLVASESAVRYVVLETGDTFTSYFLVPKIDGCRFLARAPSERSENK